MSEKIVAPSLFAANAAELGAAVALVENAGVEWLHVDVMDGSFVPNLSFGPNVVAALRPRSKLFFDVHLMIVDPAKHLPAFLGAGADCVTVHLEAARAAGNDIGEMAALCQQHGAGFGLSIRPDTPVAAVEPYAPLLRVLLVMSIQPGFGGQAFMPEAPGRIAEAAALRQRTGAGYHISVDGGINAETGPLCRAAGADVLVAGTYLYGWPNELEQRLASLRV